jgi:8-oxo-dGTP diphosphatase
MPHIHTFDGNYDQTASAFIIRTDGNKPRLLLHRHKKSNKYLHFGGHIEIDENPWQAIAHELEEEIGYTLDQLNVLQPEISLPRFEGTHTVIHPLPVAVVSHPYDLSLKHLHTDISWVFATDQEPKLNPGADESSDIRALTKEQLESIPENEIFKNIRILSLYSLTTCLEEWKQVPASVYRL